MCNIIMMLLLIIVTSILVGALIQYYRLKQKLGMLKSKFNDFTKEKYQDDHAARVTEYSDKLLSYIQKFSTQLATIEFYNWRDNHKMDKLTEENIRKLIDETDHKVWESLNTINIVYEDTLFTKEYVGTCIADTVMLTIKNLLNKEFE